MRETLLAVGALSRRALFAMQWAGVSAALAINAAHSSVPPPADLDASFGQGGYSIAALSESVDARGYSLVLLGNGDVLVGGTCGSYRTDGSILSGACVTKFTAVGVLDTSYAGGTGQAIVSDCGETRLVRVAALSDGSALVVGRKRSDYTDICVAKFTPSGEIDISFGQSGVVTLAITANQNEYPANIQVTGTGRILVLGTCDMPNPALGISRFGCLVALNADGSRDASFGNAGVAQIDVGFPGRQVINVWDIVPGDGGAFYVVATCTAGTSFDALCVTKHAANGQVLPRSFNASSVLIATGLPHLVTSLPDDVYTDIPAQLLRDRDGFLLLAATCLPDGVSYSTCVARYRPDGTQDMAYGTGGIAKFSVGVGGDTIFRSARMQQDGKVLLVSGYSGTSGSTRVTRLLADGAPDTTFGLAGTSAYGAITSADSFEAARGGLTSSGALVVGGTCWPQSSGITRVCAMKIHGGPYPGRNCSLNVDGNLVLEPATDAFAALRYLLGLRGTALTDGAVGPNPGRSNAEIEAYLADLLAQGKLDADGDGQTLAMTDGLLILRAMLGLSGDALTAGAVNAAHPNVRNAQQILTWVESTHGVACLP